MIFKTEIELSWEAKKGELASGKDIAEEVSKAIEDSLDSTLKGRDPDIRILTKFETSVREGKTSRRTMKTLVPKTAAL